MHEQYSASFENVTGVSGKCFSPPLEGSEAGNAKGSLDGSQQEGCPGLGISALC